MKKQVLAKFIDQTNLKPGQTEQYITEFCKEADEAGFASVCILPTLVETATSVLKNTNTKVCTVISFPLGMDVPEVKICATKEAIEKGAEEIDLVLNVCALKSGLYNIVNQELFGVIETPLLNEEQIIKACELAEANQVDIVKTSTGFSAMLPRSTSVEDVKLIRKHIKPTTGLKAAGGIRITADALKMIEAGATRIGASSGKEIVAGLDE